VIATGGVGGWTLAQAEIDTVAIAISNERRMAHTSKANFLWVDDFEFLPVILKNNANYSTKFSPLNVSVWRIAAVIR